MSQQRRCTRKVSPCKVTAIFELKPPPYPLVIYEVSLSIIFIKVHTKFNVHRLGKSFMISAFCGLPLAIVAT